MRLSRSLRRLYTWIALLAVLGAAMAPTISRALASVNHGATPWLQICTAAGEIRLDPGAPDGKRQPARGGLHLDHCALCTFHAVSGEPPLLGQAGAQALTGFTTVPRPAVVVPRARLPWSVAHPRAPPVLPA